MFFKTRSNIERLLLEFPWMWGVNPSWYEESRIEVLCQIRVLTIGDGDIAVLHDVRSCAPHTWWVKATRHGSIQDPLGEVRRVENVAGKTVAQRILDTFGSPYMYQYFVAHYDVETEGNTLPYYIYRAPRGQILKDFLIR